MPTLDASRNTRGGPGKAYETFIATRPIGHILVYGTPRPGCHGSAPHAPRPRSSIKKRLLLQAAEAKSLTSSRTVFPAPWAQALWVLKTDLESILNIQRSQRGPECAVTMNKMDVTRMCNHDEQDGCERLEGLDCNLVNVWKV